MDEITGISEKSASGQNVSLTSFVFGLLIASMIGMAVGFLTFDKKEKFVQLEEANRTLQREKAVIQEQLEKAQKQQTASVSTDSLSKMTADLQASIKAQCEGKTETVFAPPKAKPKASYVVKKVVSGSSAKKLPFTGSSSDSKTCSVFHKDGRLLADFLVATKNPKGVVVQTGAECLKERDEFVQSNHYRTITREVVGVQK